MSALRASRIFLAVSLAIGTIATTVTSDASRDVTPQRDRMEYPEDAPLPAARPVPGAPLASIIQFGPYRSIQVNVDATGANIPGDAANEPSFAIDPTNPLHMVIGWRQFDNVHSNFRQAGHAYSTDEGRTWTFPGVLTPGLFRSDPVLAANDEGEIGYLSLQGDFTMDYFKSADGGVTWSAPVPAFGGDKEWLAIDRTAGIGNDNIYSFYTDSQGFTRSTNDGASFQTPQSIPRSPQWGTMAVAADGELDIVGIDGFTGGTVFSKSTDARDPADPTTSWTTSNINLGGVIQSFTGPNPEGLLGQPWIAIDPSPGARNGWRYIVSTVDPSGADPADVKFIRSINGGANWSAPVRINDDSGTSAWQWFGTMSVAPTGRIDVVWNDTRGQSQSNISALYYSYSTDGGTTWAANQQLSPTWNSFIGWPNQSKIGDYYHMISDRVGASLAWAATFNSEQDVYFLRIGDYDCNDNGVGDSLDIATGTSPDMDGNSIPDECEGLATSIAGFEAPAASAGSHPNPFSQSTTIRFTLPAAGGHVRLSIYDVTGKLVRTLVDEAMTGGEKSAAWDGSDSAGRRLPDGAYFYRLVTPEKTETHRTVLLH